ncbi:MAG: hypothetical protein KIS76_07140 [Pyrinomonadaceae bacterium]|nr:hypothetical protein [Pyrinomonadaceae bacterium]
MKKLLTIFISMMIGTGVCVAQQDSAFTFQGKLNDGGTAANGNYDMAFRLFDDVNAGTQVGSTLTINNVSVANGIFSVELDFTHAPFVTVSQRFLQIAIRPAGNSDTPTILSPRQKITSSPFASQSFNANIAAVASTANNLSCNECVDEANVSPGTGAGIVNTYFFSGSIANIPAGPGVPFVFAGPTTSVTISSLAGNRVTGSASAALATFSPSSAVIHFAMCYQTNGSGTITPFDSDFLLSTVNSSRSPFAYSGTTVFPVGTHTVGFCVKNIGPAIENNHRVSGWVMVPK